MKILITGCGGQLGSDCVTVLRDSHEIVPLTARDMDITDLKKVEEIIAHIRPTCIVNCASFSNVDACESERELAWKVNAEGPRNLALMTEKYKCRLMHISTDYVFNGRKKPPAFYIESDELDPLSYYGETKVAAERAISEATDRYIIVRTAWMYGLHGRNFPKTMLRMACNNSKNEIKVVSDQFGSPTWSYTLATQIEKLITSDGQGIYNATAEGYCTWYNLALYFLEKMDIPHKIVSCKSSDYPTPARRPKNSILENARLKEEGINIMNDWRQDVDRYVGAFRLRLLDEAKEIKGAGGSKNREGKEL